MRRARVFTVIGAVLGVLLGLGEPAFASTSLVLAVDTPPQSMDPGGSMAEATLALTSNIFEPLFERAGYEGTLVPCLAEKFESVDPYTWKFYLRKGVKFHNGNPFTAQDVKFSFERLKDPKCCSQYLDRGKAIESIQIIDDYTISLKTTVPSPNYPYAIQNQLIMDKESSETRDQGDLTRRPNGTGPYKLVEWVEGSHVKLVANDQYWGGAPSTKDVTIRLITESSTRYAALASGEVELISGIPAELMERMAKDPNIEIITRPSRRVIYLALGNKPGTPAADIRVRRAMYMAINEDEIVKLLMRGQAVPAAQVPSGDEFGFVKDMKRLPYDLEQAKKLLTEAGYPNGFEITLAGPNDRYPRMRRSRKLLQNIWRRLASNAGWT